MKRTGITELPLHGGKCPPWLFKRMKRLAGEITRIIVYEYSQDEFLRRISDPFWFQAFGCVLSFDWHSSGVSTTVTGALKESIKPDELGIAVCGGKGRASRKAQEEIQGFGDMVSLSTKKTEGLKYASRMSAKVDNTAVQDDYNLYHHAFFLTEKGKWSVVQQGMNPKNHYARRYHWLSEDVKSFVNEPHKGIICDRKEESALNMISIHSKEARKVSVDAVKDFSGIQRLFSRQTLLQDFSIEKPKILRLPKTHYIINMNKRNLETLKKASEFRPGNYEELLSLQGIGPKSIRALALISELVYGKPANWEDPVKFSFSHGGKDGVPYKTSRSYYDRSIEILKTGIEQAKLGSREKLRALRRLQDFL